jgi:hypothetical protein
MPCQDCNEPSGHKWWCRTARWNREDYKVIFANGLTLSEEKLKAHCYYGTKGEGHFIKSARSQRHLDPKMIARHGGKLVKI